MTKLQAVRKNAEPQLVELGGRTRQLKFDLNSFAELENIYGSVEKAMEHLQSGSMKGVTTILWAALIHDEAVLDEVTGEPIKYNITRFQVGGWVNPNDLSDVMEKLSKVLFGDLPESAIKEAVAKAQEDTKIPNLPQ